MTQYQAKLRDAKQIQRGLQVPSRELKNFMEYLKVSASEKSSFLPCGGCMRNYIPTDQSFHRAFKFFTKQQKIQYYYRVVQIVKECLESKYPNNYEKKQETKTNYNIFFYNDDEGAWESRAIRIEFEQKKFIFKSTNEEINLGYYILRISKKRDRKSLALESIDDLQNPTTIRVSGHKDLTTDQLKQLLQKLIFDATKEKFKEMINKASAQNGRKKNQPDFRLLRSQSKQMQTNIQRTNSLILPPDLEVRNAVDTKMLNVMPKSMEGDYSFSNKREPSDIQSLKWKLKLKAALNNFENLDEFQKNLYVNIKEKRVRKVYDIKEEEFCFYWEWFIDILMSPSTFKRWKTTLTKAKTLSKKKNQKIIYEQHDFKLFTTSYIYKREVIEQNIDSLFIFDSWAQDPTNEYTSNNKIEYVMWSFQKISRTINVIVQAKISHDASRIASQTFNLIPQFLGDISKVCQNTNISFVGDSNFNVNTILFERQYLSMLQENDLDDSQEFLTIFGDSDKNSSTIRIIQDIQNSEPQYLQILKDVILPDKPNLFATFTPTNRLNYRHPIYPLPKADRPHLKLPKMPGQCPYWQNQFTFNQKGDMISINKQKIKAQSGVLSKVLGGMAKNFFSGKSILNMSLPVSIFSKDSNLSLLCKSLAYAPLHLQKAAKTSDPVERMKWVVAFATGCTTAYIQMDKPFNPILGQTYHCMIDGCPVYGEQISHHPPTSAMFMKGRGYTLYGNFQAKVSIGLNTATGSNDGICHISFDEKDYSKNVIKYNYQPGEISGLTFGDRIIHAVGTSCYLDVQNCLFVRLKFGKHKGVTEYCKFFNGIEGELVKLDKKTDLSKFPDIDSSRVVQTYGMFSGRWSQEIYYQGDPIFNSWKEYPYLCEKYPFPLESDAFYRKDLLLKIEDKDQQAAQEAKVELQQIQRNDRKLRAKYHGNKH